MAVTLPNRARALPGLVVNYSFLTIGDWDEPKFSSKSAILRRQGAVEVRILPIMHLLFARKESNLSC